MGKNLKILVVDDEPMAVAVFAGALEKSGYMTESASGGREAIELIKSWKPHICICDIYMPGVSGFDVLKFVKKEYPDIRMLMITGNSDPQSLREAFRLGADEFVTKPISSQDITLIVDRIYLRHFDQKVPSAG